jgi:hypothetical protein
MDQDTWRFINTFAPWAAALGTFSAVVVSLYLARKSNRIDLEVRAGIRSVGFIGGRPITGSRFPEPPQLVWFGITNVGPRSATVTSIYWRPIFWRKSGYLVLPAQNEYSSVFPITLDDGEAANYAWLLSGFRIDLRNGFLDELTGFFEPIRLQLLRVCVGTSTGDVFCCKPEKELRELLRKMATAQTQ